MEYIILGVVLFIIIVLVTRIKIVRSEEHTSELQSR